MSSQATRPSFTSRHGDCENRPVSSPTEDLWRGQSSAARAAERRERLLAAGTELLGTLGAPETTVRGVCRDAGVGLRYFYESFRDVDALLVEAYDRVADALTARVLEEVMTAPADPQARARVAFGAALAFITEDPRRGRILFRETVANDALREHGAQTVPRFVSLVATALTDESERGTAVDDNRRALQISALSGALVKLFLDWLSGQLSISQDQLVNYCTEVMWSIIGN